ncbi:unnamed protein product [Bemisia tabaci]|uniref:Uncharacterized protein n=1 Tax=Bemisia tabaci TaxID=7038 RepID=A0A9P0G4R4_BEMTA|nr:unnamed protein product [Bemisia tabaci]
MNAFMCGTSYFHRLVCIRALQRWLICGLLAGVSLAQNPSPRQHITTNLRRQPFQLAPLGRPHTDVNQQINAQFSPAVPLTYENLRPQEYQAQIFGSNLQPPNVEYYQLSPSSSLPESYPASAPSNLAGYQSQSTRKEDCEHSHESHHPHETHKQEPYNHPHEAHHTQRPNPQFSPAIHTPWQSVPGSPAPGAQVSGGYQQAAPPAVNPGAQLEPAILIYSVDRQPPYVKDQAPSMTHRESAQLSPAPSVPGKDESVSVAVEQNPGSSSFRYAYSYPIGVGRSSASPDVMADWSSGSEPNWLPNTVSAWSTAWQRDGKSAALWPPNEWLQNTRANEWPKPSGAQGVAHSLTSPSGAQGVAHSLTSPSGAQGVAHSLTSPSGAHGVAHAQTSPLALNSARPAPNRKQSGHLNTHV